MKKNFSLLFLIFLFSSLFFYGCEDIIFNYESESSQDISAFRFTDNSVFEKAFQEHQGSIQVTQQAEIIKILPDDTRGSKHQRFIVKLESGQSLLIAHNIDIAKRIPGLKTGKLVIFHGEYEWNDKGGVIHWTHHDPSGKREDGWLEYRGKRYE